MRLTLAWLLGSPFLLSRRCRRARSHGLGFCLCRRARRRGLGLVGCRRVGGRRLGFWRRFAMLGHGSVSFHCTLSAPGSFVTKASRLETGLLISSRLDLPRDFLAKA